MGNAIPGMGLPILYFERWQVDDASSWSYILAGSMKSLLYQYVPFMGKIHQNTKGLSCPAQQQLGWL